MIEITDGFMSISAGSDSIEGTRVPTGARITVEFRRATPLLPDQRVRVRYDFAGDGHLREGTGVAKPIRTVVRWGHAVFYDYRLSYWIAASALMSVEAGEARDSEPLGTPGPSVRYGSNTV